MQTSAHVVGVPGAPEWTKANVAQYLKCTKVYNFLLPQTAISEMIKTRAMKFVDITTRILTHINFFLEFGQASLLPRKCTKIEKQSQFLS